MARTLDDLLSNAGWDDLLQYLPPDLDDLCLETGAIERWRSVRDGAELLRICLGFAALGKSLRGVSAWWEELGGAPISDVGILKILRRAVGFLEGVLCRLFETYVVSPVVEEGAPHVRLLDATCLSVPGSDGTDYRIHLTWDASTGQMAGLQITDKHGGEHFGRGYAGARDILVGDRGNAHANRVIELTDAGTMFLVRVGHSAIRMTDAAGEPFDPLAFATRRRSQPGRPPRVESTVVRIRDNQGRTMEARLLLVRKSAGAAEHERRRVRSESTRKGKTAQQRTLDAAGFMFLLTSVPAGMAGDVALADLYRVRWQVELAFKRWKSIAKLGEIRAKDPQLIYVWILGKIIAVAGAEMVGRRKGAFSPWGAPLRPTLRVAHRQPLPLDASRRHPRRRATVEKP